MERYTSARIQQDLAKKMVILTGARQVGKTTLSRQLVAQHADCVYLNYDVPRDRAVMLAQAWPPQAPLIVLDEIHKMPQWKSWLKGVFDGRWQGDGHSSHSGKPPQQILVTGSARMDTFKQTGESLAGRYLAHRLHPISVREWCAHTGDSPDAAMRHLLARGGFPEPCLAPDELDAQRWRNTYFTDMLREDLMEFSRIQEVNAMRMFAQLLRQRVGSPLSLASIARDMNVSPKTLTTYLDILQALFIVFIVRPWGHNIARATLLQPKVYFYDTGLVQGDEGIRFENLVACHLLKNAHWNTDSLGQPTGLHYIRTKDGAEVDFCLSDESQPEPTLTHLIECKTSDANLHRALARFAGAHPKATSLQLVRDLAQAQERGGIGILPAAQWLHGMEV
jgi:uncharacterized protein